MRIVKKRRVTGVSVKARFQRVWAIEFSEDVRAGVMVPMCACSAWNLDPRRFVYVTRQVTEDGDKGLQVRVLWFTFAVRTERVNESDSK